MTLLEIHERTGQFIKDTECRLVVQFDEAEEPKLQKIADKYSWTLTKTPKGAEFIAKGWQDNGALAAVRQFNVSTTYAVSTRKPKTQK